MSALKPSIFAPKSISSASPGLSGASSGVPCGFAALAPASTMGSKPKPVGAMGKHPGLQQGRDGSLGIAGLDLVEGLAQRQLTDLDGAGKSRDLVLVLGDAERLQGRIGVPHLAVAHVAAQRIVFEHAHPPAFDAEGRSPQRAHRGLEGGLEAVAVLPVEGLGVGEGARPLQALELRHDRKQPAARRHEQQRRALHQVEVEAGEIVEARPRHEGGGVQARVSDQRRRTVAAPGYGPS